MQLVFYYWGRTKNVFLFEAPWNICYTPKIIDPLTGHETKGDLPVDFQKYFIKYAQKKYKKYILDYNSIISQYDIDGMVEKFCELNNIEDLRFKADAKSELSVIQILKKND